MFPIVLQNYDPQQLFFCTFQNIKRVVVIIYSILSYRTSLHIKTFQFISFAKILDLLFEVLKMNLIKQTPQTIYSQDRNFHLIS
jgi:hypothetical protein